MSHRLRTREWSGVDYYAELGISSDASRPAVDEAYRRQAKLLHPDRNPDPTAEERFKRLTAAYEVLRDPVTRQAYDDFRFRVDAGLLYAAPAGSRPAPAAASWSAVRARAAASERKERRRLPNGARVGIGWGLIVAGIAAALWALLGDLPSHTAGDTNVAVQITLGIMAAKLLICGVIVIKYPQLRARWHRPQGVRMAPAVSQNRQVIGRG
ncbi:MAG: J domain-containing protein [Acidimicrobiia bacterium]